MSALVSLLVRLLLTVATVVLVLTLMAVAVVSMLGLLLWSLLRGRKPVIDVSGFARARQFRPGQRPGQRAGAGPGRPTGEVVDVEVTEVREVHTPMRRLEP